PPTSARPENTAGHHALDDEDHDNRDDDHTADAPDKQDNNNDDDATAGGDDLHTATGRAHQPGTIAPLPVPAPLPRPQRGRLPLGWGPLAGCRHYDEHGGLRYERVARIVDRGG